ncbi:10196_t:CDS:2, partial [Dentiscutata erythropus]
AYNSKFVLPFLAMASSVCGAKVKIYPEEYIQGKYGRGPVDFCMILEKIIISVLEVKRDDFIQGTAQIIVQLHSSLERRHEDDDFVIDKAYGIVTDSKLWYFFECSMNGDKPEYRIHSEEGTSINWGSNFEEGVTEVLGQIVWLFKDAEKLIESAKQKKASFVVDGQTQNGKEAIAEVWLSIDNSVSTVDLFNSVVDQQNNANTKSI